MGLEKIDGLFEKNELSLSKNMKFNHVGTMNKTIQIFVNIFAGDDEILIGYKGNTEIDAGFIFSPYTILMYAGVIFDPKTFSPHIALMSRYGIYYDKISSYYTTLSIERKEQ